MSEQVNELKNLQNYFNIFIPVASLRSDELHSDKSWS